MVYRRAGDRREVEGRAAEGRAAEGGAADRIEYLMLRRVPERGGFWQSVSGNMNEGEEAESAARREVREETGFEPQGVLTLETINVFSRPGDERTYLEPCFGVEVGSGEPILSAEHDAHRWLEFREARELLPYAGMRKALDELDRRLAEVKASPPNG